MCYFEKSGAVYNVGDVVTFPNGEKRIVTASQSGVPPYDCSKSYTTGMLCEFRGTVYMSNGLACGPEPFITDHWVIPPPSIYAPSQNKNSVL